MDKEDLKEVHWCKYVQSDFTVNYQGHTMGLGAHPGITCLGLWNLVYTLMPDEVTEPYLKKSLDPGKLTMDHPYIPLIIGTGYQQYAHGKSVALAAGSMSPSQFIKEVEAGEGYKNLILTLLWPDWISIIKDEAKEASHRNVIQVNFNVR